MDSRVPQEKLATVIDFAAAKRARVSRAVIERSASVDQSHTAADAEIVDLFSPDDPRITDPFGVLSKLTPDALQQELYLTLAVIHDETGYDRATAAARSIASILLNHKKITPEDIRGMLS